MAEEKTFSVKVRIHHSPEIARIWMSHAYTPHDKAKLEEFHETRGPREVHPALPSTTSLGEVKSILERDFGIRTAILHFFPTYRTIYNPIEFVDGKPDEMTIQAALELMDPIDAEEFGHYERILMLPTTAGWLHRLDGASTIDEALSFASEIIASLKEWRHCSSGLQYLLQISNVHDDENDGQAIQNSSGEIDKYKELEEAAYRRTVKYIKDWYLLTGIQPPSQFQDEELHSWSLVTDSESVVHLDPQQPRLDLESLYATWKHEKLERLRKYLKELPEDSPHYRSGQSEPPASDDILVTQTAASSAAQPEAEAPKESKSFNVTSGAVLWGQMATVIEGFVDERFQNRLANAQEPLEGGTILQHTLKFKCAARNGKWNVSRAFSDRAHSFRDLMTEEKPFERFGWVVHHQDYDPVDMLRRCNRITSSRGISNSNRHVDKGVLFIGRYDWAIQHSADEDVEQECKQYFQDNVIRHLGPLDPGLDPTGGDERLFDPRKSGAPCYGHCIVVDEQSWNSRQMQHIIQEGLLGSPMSMERLGLPRERNDHILTSGDEAAEQRATGVCMVDTWVEYEFGWLVFSGQKSETYLEQDELVGIVYDSSYEALDGMDYAVNLPE